jgi:hypothetical protein
MANDIRELNKREFGPEIPEQVKNFFAADPERWGKPVMLTHDVARITATSKSGISKEDAEAIAFMLWRGRMVAREFKLTFAEGLEHGWLRTETFKVANERRKARIAANEARRERLNSLVLTGGNPDTLDRDAQVE